MSHTTLIPTKSGNITVIHNGDWSGPATIRVPGMGPVTLPGEALLALGRAIGRQEIRDQVIALVEDIDDDTEDLELSKVDPWQK